MGNSFGGKKTAKIMKINGETIKFKTRIQARDIVKDYPGHVVLDSEAVKHYGIRAKPLDPFRNLEPRRVYFLVELPKFPNGQGHQHRVPRRARSGINMSAKDRLESLMLARRSVSDLSSMGAATPVEVVDGLKPGGSGLRVRMRLPKAEVERLINQPDEAAEKIGAANDAGRMGKEHDISYNGNSGNKMEKSFVQRDQNYQASGRPAGCEEFLDNRS